MMYHVVLPNGSKTKFRAWNDTVIDGGPKFAKYEKEPLRELIAHLQKMGAVWKPVPET